MSPASKLRSLFTGDRRTKRRSQTHAFQPRNIETVENRLLLSGTSFESEDPGPAEIVRTIIPGEVVIAIANPGQTNIDDAIHRISTAVPLLQHDPTTSQSLGEHREILTLDNPAAGTEFTIVELTVDESSDIEALAKQIGQLDEVVWAAPNYRYTGHITDFVPDDPDFTNQYHHTLIQNDVAWDTTLGDSNIVIAITDTGVQTDHPDLADNLWVNPGEIANNGIDDDGNGRIDDINGWDFVSNDNDPNPIIAADDHGTHVAGISAAVTNNGVGVSGVAGGASIMAIRIAGSDGGFSSTIMADTFRYAIDSGAHIMNTSFNINGFVNDPIFTAGIQYFYDGGGLHFNSAGNANQANPVRQAFHSTLLVASTDAADQKSGFSNYGDGVDIAAPGSAILSTETNSSYGFKSGTSMAAPNAAGVAALVWSVNPTWTRDQVVAAVLATADNIDAQNPGFEGQLGAGRVNSANAIQAGVLIAAPQVDTLTGLPDNRTQQSILDPVTSATIRFDQVMAPDTINDATNIRLTEAGANGIHGDADDITIAITPDVFYRTGTNELTYTFDNGALDFGKYVFTVPVEVTNPFGISIDGDGDGTGGDAFQRFFDVVAPPFEDIPPLGVQIGERELFGTVTTAGEIVEFTADLDADQMMTVRVDSGGTLQPRITVFDPVGQLIADSGDNGGPVEVIQGIHPSVSGQYRIEVTGRNNSTGNFDFTTLLNATYENESITGETNNAIADAEPLPANVILGNGVSRSAVVATGQAGQSDWYSLTPSDTGINTLIVSNLDDTAPASTLELFDANGFQLASGIATDNLTSVVAGFAGTNDSTYFARVQNSGDDYSIVLVNNADFDAEPNDTISQPLTFMQPASSVVGHVNFDEFDVYTFRAETGAELTIETATPASGDLSPINDIDPTIQLVSPTGRLIDYTNTVGDERLLHTASEAGLYTVTVSSNAEDGEYVLSVSGNEDTRDEFQVTSVTPGIGIDIPNPLTEILLTFNDVVLSESADLNGITIDGIPVSGVRRLDAMTLALDFAVLPGGDHILAVEEAALIDLQGTPVSAFTSGFSTHNGPVLVSSSINPNDEVAGDAFSVDFTFDQALATTTLDLTDISLVGDFRGTFAPDAFSYNPGTFTLTVDFTNIPEDRYDLILSSGDDAFQDLDGNDLDAEFVDPGFGDGTPGGDLVFPLFADSITVAFPEIQALLPLGSLAYQATAIGNIRQTGDIDSYTIDVDAEQTLSFAVTPSDDMSYLAEILGPDGTVEFTTLASNGDPFVTNATDFVVQGAGTYSLRITSLAGTSQYEVRALLNSAYETENFGGAENNTPATAQSIEPFLSERPTGNGQDIGSFVGFDDGDEDWFHVQIPQGETATISVTGQTARRYEVELFDASGTTKLAHGISTVNMDQVIDRFVSTDADDYLIRVSSEVAAGSEYNLVVTRNATFDSESNSSQELAQLVVPAEGVFGHLNTVDLATSDPGTLNGPIPVISQFAGPDATAFIPPDPTVAAGPDQIVASVNTEILIYDKDSGTELFSQNLNGPAGFFGSVGAVGTVFDPWVLYDHESDRFFVVGIDLNTANDSSAVYLAVSTDSTPVDGDDWHKYQIDFTHNATGTGLGTGNHFPDYEKVGVNSDALFVSGNYFAINAGSGVYSGITALEKTPLLNGDPVNVLYEEHFSGFSVFPMQQYGNTTTQYFAETRGSGQIRIHAIDDVLSPIASRTTFDLAVPDFGATINVPQLGGGVAADSLGTRIMTGVYRDGSLWFAHGATDPAIGDGETLVRWYEVADNGFGTAGGSDPTLVQSGNVDPGPGVHAWVPAINVDAVGNMGIAFAVGGPNQFYGAGFTGRLSGDPLGATVLPITEYAVGQGNYQRLDGNGRNRWGDYSGLALDPNDDATFWVFNERATDTNSWTTEIASFQLGSTIDEDWYSISVNAGDLLSINTSTVGDQPGNFVNQLDPGIELLTPSGLLVTHTNIGGNESLTHLTAESGEYLLRIFGESSTEGEYHVEILGATGDDVGPFVVDTDPDDATTLPAFPTTYTLDFSETILASSVLPSDLFIGGLPALSVSVIDGNTFEFTVDPAANFGDGVYDVVLATDRVVDLQGIGNTEFLGTFELDTTGPVIVSSQWNGGAFSSSIDPLVPLTTSFTFNEPLLILGSAAKGPFAPGFDDIQIVNTTTGDVFPATSLDYDPATLTVTMTFDGFAEGNYQLRLNSGDIAFEDEVGNDLDGEAIGPNPDGTVTGDGVNGGDYEIDFVVDFDTNGATDFDRVRPFAGYLTESIDNTGLIHSATDNDAFTFVGRQGEIVSASLTTLQANVQATLELVGPSGIISIGPDSLPAIALPEDGTYQLVVSGDSEFDYNLTLHGGFQTEAIVGGDSSSGNPLPVTGTELPNGVGLRYAVSGTASAEFTPTRNASFVGIDTAGDQSTVYDIDADTAVISNPRVLDIDNAIDLARSTDGRWYTVTAGGAVTGTENALYEIDITTGATTLIGLTGVSFSEGDLDFDPRTGNLLAVNSATSQLFEIDINTGAATLLATVGGGDLSAMAFSDAGNLYLLDTLADEILRFDLVSNLITSTVSVSGDLSSDAGMDFDPDTGLLYVADGGGADVGQLYLLDPTTGELRSVGTTDAAVNGLSGIEFFNVGLETFGQLFGLQITTGEIVQIDPATGQVVNSFLAPAGISPSAGLSGAENSNTLIFQSDSDAATVYRIDPKDGSLLSTENLPASGTRSGLTFEGTDVFTIDGTASVQRQSGFSGTVSEHLAFSPDVPGALGGDDRGRHFVVSGGQIVEFDPAIPDTVLNTFAAPAIEISGLAFNGSVLFAFDSSDQSILWIDPDNGAVIDVVPFAGGTLAGLGVARVNPDPQPLLDDVVYVAQRDPSNVGGEIAVFDFDGNRINTIDHPTFDGKVLSDIEVSFSGNIYVALDVDDTNSGVGEIARFSPAGDFLGTTPLPAHPASSFELYPFGFEVLTDERLLIPQTDNERVLLVEPDGTLVASIVIPGTSPTDVGILSDGTIVISDHSAATPEGYLNVRADDLFWISEPLQNEGELRNAAGIVQQVLSVQDVGDIQEAKDGSLFTTGFLPSQLTRFASDGSVIFSADVPLAAGLAVASAEVFRPSSSINESFESTIEVIVAGGDSHRIVEAEIIAGSQNGLAEQLLSFDVDAITVDLLAGQLVDIVLAGHDGLDFSSEILELYAPDGTTLLATALNEPLGLGSDVINYDLGILGFQVTESGPHTLQIRSETLGDYAVVVSTESSFETEDNSDRTDVLRTLDAATGATGFISAANQSQDPGNLDFYTFDLELGQPVEVETFTPWLGTGVFSSDLDPVLRIETIDGTIVAIDDNSAPDGVNALTTFFAPSTGRFRAVVSAASGAGEYAVQVRPQPSVITVSTTSDSVNEAAGTAAATMTLTRNSDPSLRLFATLTNSDTSELQLPPFVEFQPGETSVTVNIDAVDDRLLDGTQDVTISVSAPGHTDVAQVIQVTDNEVAGFSIDTGNGLLVSEDGTTDEFTVVLDAGPPTDVTITITSADVTETSSGVTLTFTPDNWDEPQTATITGVDDSLFDGDVTSQLIFAVDAATSDPGFASVFDQSIDVVTLENDVPAVVVTEPTGGVVVTEAGSTSYFDISLPLEPVDDVVLLFSSSDLTEVQVITSTLTFNSTNWNELQRVHLAGMDDFVVDLDQTSAVNISVDAAATGAGFSSFAGDSVNVVTIDDEVAGIVVDLTDGSNQVSESGSTDTFDIRLTAQPITDVRIQILSSDTTEVSANFNSLLFTPENWNDRQTVTLTGEDDVVVDGTQQETITLLVNAGASDPGFVGVSTLVQVDVLDDEQPGIVINQTGPLRVSEEGTTAAFTVTLSAEPVEDIQLNLSTDDPSEILVSSSLTFTPANWNSPQLVTVVGADDFEPDGDQVSVVYVSVNAAETNSPFGRLLPASVLVETIDDEVGRLDVDGNGAANAATDGILVIRHLLGFFGNALTENAVADDATRSVGIEISDQLNASPTMLDADGDGDIEAATDGILIIRYLLGFQADALVNNAIGINATRRTGSEVQQYLQQFLPGFDHTPENATTGITDTSGEIGINAVGLDTPAPTFDWVDVSAPSYRIRIADLDQLTYLVDDIVTGSSFTSDAFTSGNYRIWIDAIGVDGSSIINSGWMEFTVADTEADSDGSQIALKDAFHWHFVDLNETDESVKDDRTTNRTDNQTIELREVDVNSGRVSETNASSQAEETNATLDEMMALAATVPSVWFD